MAVPFKVIIIGGGIAGLSLAVMLEAYGFDYDLIEKHADVAPKLGAGVGITPNGARILDQIGVWQEMLQHASPVDLAASLSPEGQTVVASSQFGDWLEKLYGYRMHFLSRHNCLRILFSKIQRRSSIHLSKEVVKVETGATGRGARVETKDGTVFTGDMVIGADGVRSAVRGQLWRIADAETPGYIPDQDKTGLMSYYTAVIGVVADNPGLGSGSTRVYNVQRSYFFSQAGKGSGEFYWWLCIKNDSPKAGIIPKLSDDLKQQYLSRFTGDRIGPNLTLGDLARKSMYTAIIPLQEFVLQKCFYKNIVLVGDTFRKVHPVAGQGANSAFEESAFIADILWDLRSRGALRDPFAIEEALTEYQSVRFVRTTALKEDGHLVQRMDSLDNGFMKFMSLYAAPRLPFEVAMLPILGASFTPARHLKHLPPPNAGRRPFSQDMKANITQRSPVASLSWAIAFIATGFLTYGISICFPINDAGLGEEEKSQLAGVARFYSSIVAASLSGIWVIESYKPAFLLSPFVSALSWILASNYWGWERTVPVYFCFHVVATQGIAHYYTPHTMSDIYAAKSLLPVLLLIYSAPVLCVYGGYCNLNGSLWAMAHCTIPVAVYLGSVTSRVVSGVPDVIDVVFSNVTLPYQQRFLTVFAGVAFSAHLAMLQQNSTMLLQQGMVALSVPAVGALATVSMATTLWCLHLTSEARRINAIDQPLIFVWASILIGTVVAGPAATLAAVFGWSRTAMARATSW
ncbi:hypothetical protein B0I35DRAFT_515346 [Stachybotrys elegans]|uniref:FAD-binding domain-containing protein n=1 Tax=Stachybotrys elegans TaxID=80388 RepID=A0A8K0SDF7_9HYPO|nr:hypothetical protein B0I35DRAFT_515346 [Stachybotrys elegans]